MSKVYVELETSDMSQEEADDIVQGMLDIVPGSVIGATVINDLATFLHECIPEEVLEDLNLIIKTNEGEREELDLSKVLDALPLAATRPAEVSAMLLKTRQGLCNMAYAMEEYYKRLEDSFRVWKAEQGRVLNNKGDTNPLIKEGSKTTNDAIESYIRAQPAYKEHKDDMSSVHSGKQMLWAAKDTVDQALEIVKSISENR